ncbi:MAG TPA: hypothetical protein VF712_06150 [Thermoleophilaceae bacterium]|jgi:hypothetical protein
MEPLLVDTEMAARTLALEIRDGSRTRPVLAIGVDAEARPLVSPNRIDSLVSPRIASVASPELVEKHLGDNDWRRGFVANGVCLYLPGSPRPVVVARDEWTTESERSLQRLLSVGESFTSSIFSAWCSRCSESPAPLPPFALTSAFMSDVRTVPSAAHPRLATTCLEVLLDDSDRTLVPVATLPTRITAVQRERDGDRVLLSGLHRDPRKRKPRTT